MIQRIQTVFLALVLAMGLALLFVPFVRYDLQGGLLNVDLMPGASLHPLSSIYLLPVFLNIISIVFTIYVIFSYKKRVLQMKLSNLLMAFNTILLGVMVLFDFAELPATTGLPAKKYLLGAFFPILSIIFSFLASYFIRKDEQLVRSADRLR